VLKKQTQKSISKSYLFSFDNYYGIYFVFIKIKYVLFIIKVTKNR
jgi:hypothetical protein